MGTWQSVGPIIFLEERTKKLNKFLTLFPTDQPMAPFLTETLDGLVRFFIEKFILKSVIDKVHSSIFFTKIDLNDVTRQKPSCLVDLKFAVHCEVKLLKSKKKVTNNEQLKLKIEAVDFFAKCVLT